MDVMKQKARARGMGIGIAIVVVLLFLIFNPITLVPAGHVGVKVLFGKVKPSIITEGLHIVNPLLSIKKMSIRTQEYTMSIAEREGKVRGDDSIAGLTKEGLSVLLDLTVWYRVIPEQAPNLYQKVGPDYETVILRPTVRTAARNVIALYEAKDIYSEKRAEATMRLTMMNEEIGGRGVEVEKVLIRNVTLPPQLTKAIEDKLAAEQQAQKMVFVLQKEQQEAQRKEIEAKGIASAQRVIANSLTTAYLQWYYVNTMKDLVDAPNNTTILMPFDQKIIPMLPLRQQQ
jgi:regulator of protease activity HflC (stomatin/prohibitin superfamily)